ncbi:hypothetical protein C2S52_011274 [Perilla frutescens var. hirtella]|nr:hypothetical protein C2S52_011274 [Perilla frutescens var. hirtella]
MKSFFIIAGLFYLALFPGGINARKYRESRTEGSVDFGKELKTESSLWVYSDDVKPKDDNLLVREVERKSSFWVYINDEEANPNKELKKPNLWVYSDDVKQRDGDETLSIEEFKTKRNLRVYNDDEFGRNSSFWVYNDQDSKIHK